MVTTDRTVSVEAVSLAAEVECMLDTTEAESEFRDTRECAGLLLALGLLLLSPPTPRPKTGKR